jgi:hypothetical protein
MVGGNRGSLSKEPRHSKLEATLRAIRPGMQYQTILRYSRTHTHRDAPGLLKQRFLLINEDDSIAYDHFLSLVAAHGVSAPLIRKIMLFLWAYRDERIRRYICECIASSSGLWSIRKLVDKNSGKFFEKWVRPATAKKARSNFEFFLVETGIFDPVSQTIHLELDDGWLEQAAIVCAQHESDLSIREELLANPVMFLKSRGWLGLLNAKSVPTTRASPLLLVDATPLEDAAIEIRPLSKSIAADWDRKSPTVSGKATTTANVDLISRERANLSHYTLEKQLADLVRGRGLTPKYNQNIDLFFETANGSVLVEIKSCNHNNFHSQLRKAISQLFEYRFVYEALVTENSAMMVLMETAPPKRKSWLADYAASVGIVLAWIDPKSREIVSKSTSLPESLTGFVGRLPK